MRGVWVLQQAGLGHALMVADVGVLWGIAHVVIHKSAPDLWRLWLTFLPLVCFPRWGKVGMGALRSGTSVKQSRPLAVFFRGFSCFPSVNESCLASPHPSLPPEGEAKPAGC